jgi:hypothetical protein
MGMRQLCDFHVLDFPVGRRLVLLEHHQEGTPISIGENSDRRISLHPFRRIAVWTAAMRFSVLTMLVLLNALAVCAHAEAKNDPKVDEARRAQRLTNMRRSAAQFTIYAGDDREHPLKLVENPVMRWANPENTAKDGTVFLWTRRGRPLAMLQLFTYDDEHFSHEWQSLDRGPLTAARGQDVEWSPEEPGVEFTPLTDVEEPGTTAAARLRQMKALAGRFSSTHVGFTENQTPVELRLLPQPLYRYAPDPETPALVDGALFAFVQGTDPQSLLILEARRDGTKTGWHFAFARMASGAVAARYQEREVFSVPKYDFQRRNPRKPYYLLASQPVPEEND